MIIRCHACGKRVSDQMRTCPHCHVALGELTPEEIRKQERRRYQTRVYRARMITHAGMGLALIGILWWWLSGDALMLAWPPPSATPIILAFVGLITYIGGRGTMVYLQWQHRRDNR